MTDLQFEDDEEEEEDNDPHLAGKLHGDDGDGDDPYVCPCVCV